MLSICYHNYIRKPKVLNYFLLLSFISIFCSSRQILIIIQHLYLMVINKQNKNKYIKEAFKIIITIPTK